MGSSSVCPILRGVSVSDRLVHGLMECPICHNGNTQLLEADEIKSQAQRRSFLF